MRLTGPRGVYMIAIAIISLFFVGEAIAADPQPLNLISKPYSAMCKDVSLGEVYDPPINAVIPHQYMLLLMFKRGAGARYFGHPKVGENGCIADVPHSDPVTTWPTRITVENCPNDCVYPRVPHMALNDGKDPLYGSASGIVSAVDSAPMPGGKGRHIEVWQIAVIDKCHAQALYAALIGKKGKLEDAYRRHILLGEVVIGFSQPGEHLGPSAPTCPVIK